jgi:DNA-binding transcriptional LysR family regulator
LDGARPGRTLDGVNLQQLRYFVAVVDAGSFTAAARRLYVTQPSLSQQLRALEAELGGELVTRLQRGLAITPAGEAFLPRARAALRAADDAAALARRAIAEGPGNLCLAVTPAVPPALVAAALARWAGAGDERVARWHDYPTQQRVEEKARAGVGTVALGVRPPAWEGPLVSLGHDELVVCLPAGHALAGADGPVALGLLAGEAWIGIEREDAERDMVGAAFASAGFLPRELYECSGSGPALRLVEAGLGVALVARSAVPVGAGVAVAALEDPPRRELAAFTDRPWSPTALEFLAALVTEAAAPLASRAPVLPAPG